MSTPLSADTLVQALRAEGLRVVEYGSWRTHNRNHAGPWGPVHGVMIHHTVTQGTASTVKLCYDGHTLPGPLCHGVIAKDGTVYLVGHGRANHAGLGDGDVLRAVIAEEPLPPDNDADTDGNTHFYGFECENLGDGTDPWPEVQVEAVVRVSAALCRAHGWTQQSVIGHLEWQPGKIDPRGPGITMTGVRERVGNLLGENVALTDEDVQRIAEASARQVALYKDTRLDSRDARQMWDDASSPHRLWGYRPTGSEGPDAWGLLMEIRDKLDDVLEMGGLDAVQTQEIAELGAQSVINWFKESLSRIDD